MSSNRIEKALYENLDFLDDGSKITYPSLEPVAVAVSVATTSTNTVLDEYNDAKQNAMELIGQYKQKNLNKTLALSPDEINLSTSLPLDKMLVESDDFIVHAEHLMTKMDQVKLHSEANLVAGIRLITALQSLMNAVFADKIDTYSINSNIHRFNAASKHFQDTCVKKSTAKDLYTTISGLADTLENISTNIQKINAILPHPPKMKR